MLHAIDHSVPRLDRRLHAELYSPVTNLDKITAVYKETCERRNQTLPNYEHIHFAQPWTQFDDILLVITFNTPHYESIPYVETLYRPFFPNILYCGSSSVNVSQSVGIDNVTFSFISYQNIEGHAPGSFNYKCMLTAMQMGYDVQGVLVASDDLLLLVHRLSDMRRDLVWYVPKIHTLTGDFTNFLQCKYGSCNIKSVWVPWEKYKKVTMAALSEIRDSNKSATMSACYRRLLSENGSPERANAALADIFYIPRKLWQSYTDFFEVFLRHKVFLEIAVPTIIRCLGANADIDLQPLFGDAKWGKHRDKPWQYFIPTRWKSFYHPIKWGFIGKTSKGRTDSTTIGLYKNLFCNKIMPYLHDRLATPID